MMWLGVVECTVVGCAVGNYVVGGCHAVWCGVMSHGVVRHDGVGWRVAGSGRHGAAHHKVLVVLQPGLAVHPVGSLVVLEGPQRPRHDVALLTLVPLVHQQRPEGRPGRVNERLVHEVPEGECYDRLSPRVLFRGVGVRRPLLPPLCEYQSMSRHKTRLCWHAPKGKAHGVLGALHGGRHQPRPVPAALHGAPRQRHVEPCSETLS